MRMINIEAAIHEAHRFLDRAETVKRQSQYLDESYWGKDSAALRRASMDLTRALAAMRQS